jgi:hypothetical protein
MQRDGQKDCVQDCVDIRGQECWGEEGEVVEHRSLPAVRFPVAFSHAAAFPYARCDTEIIIALKHSSEIAELPIHR